MVLGRYAVLQLAIGDRNESFILYTGGRWVLPVNGVLYGARWVLR